MNETEKQQLLKMRKHRVAITVSQAQLLLMLIDIFQILFELFLKIDKITLEEH